MTHGRMVALQQQKHFTDAAKSCVTSLHNAASRSLFALARLGREQPTLLDLCHLVVSPVAWAVIHTT